MKYLLLFGCFFIAVFTLQSQNDDRITFESDIAFLQKHTEIVVLGDETAKIVIAPQYEARVMTSTLSGGNGFSFGYIDYAFIEKHTLNNGGNPYGGEDRLWLGPLGSKYSLFYGEDPITSENWSVPPAFDRMPYTLQQQSDNSMTFSKQVKLTNNVGAQFNISLERRINLLTRSDIERLLQLTLPRTAEFVAFQSQNTVTNLGEDWQLEKGLVAPWVLGMFKGNDGSVALFPYEISEEHPVTVQTYLAEVDESRLKVTENTILFKTDGAYRSKIGLNKHHSTPIIGNYDAQNSLLTIVLYTMPSGNYLSTKELAEDILFGGDVVSCYNNAMVADNATFFELETAAPATPLRKNEAISHTHTTIHLKASFEDLSALTKIIFGTDLNTVTTVFE